MTESPADYRCGSNSRGYRPAPVIGLSLTDRGLQSEVIFNAGNFTRLIARLKGGQLP